MILVTAEEAILRSFGWPNAAVPCFMLSHLVNLVDPTALPTIADAVLDRLVHNAHMITMSMKAESMRKLLSKNK